MEYVRRGHTGLEVSRIALGCMTYGEPGRGNHHGGGDAGGVARRRQGRKARYIGASSMYAWQLAKALYLADLHGWTRFVAMQEHDNLLQREEEREMLPLCLDQGIGVLLWSTLARGRLTRDWDESTNRSETDAFGSTLYDLDGGDRTIAERVAQIAAERGVPRAQVALAWVARHPAVTASVVGASKPHHVDDAVASLALQLSDEEVRRLEEPYRPHAVAGF